MTAWTPRFQSFFFSLFLFLFFPGKTQIGQERALSAPGGNVHKPVSLSSLQGKSKNILSYWPRNQVSGVLEWLLNGIWFSSLILNPGRGYVAKDKPKTMPSEGNQTRKSGQGVGLANGHLLEVGDLCDPRGCQTWDVNLFSKHSSKWLDANRSAAEDGYNQDNWSLAALVSRMGHEDRNPGWQSSRLPHSRSFFFSCSIGWWFLLLSDERVRRLVKRKSLYKM